MIGVIKSRSSFAEISCSLSLFIRLDPFDLEITREFPCLLIACISQDNKRSASLRCLAIGHSLRITTSSDLVYGD